MHGPDVSATIDQAETGYTQSECLWRSEPFQASSPKLAVGRQSPETTARTADLAGPDVNESAPILIFRCVSCRNISRRLEFRSRQGASSEVSIRSRFGPIRDRRAARRRWDG